MKSSFFHVGVNRSLAANSKGQLQEPQLQPDGSLPYVPLPDHRDPDFERLTYGDPFGRLRRLEIGDVAWFIESGTDGESWGYYLVAFFDVQAVYSIPPLLSLQPSIPLADLTRIVKNAHHQRGDSKYDVVLGGPKSQLLFQNPVKISNGQDPLPWIKELLALPQKPLTGYWFKRWFESRSTMQFLLSVLGSYPKVID
jgi:hypothetical protein